MKKLMVTVFLILTIAGGTIAAEFFSTAYLETFRVDPNNYMLSPNIFVKYGRLEGYGFIDKYTMYDKFYHGEFMVAFQPLTIKPLDRISVIAERRWDKYSKDENSIGLRLKIW